MKKNISFEEAITMLDDKVKMLESGGLSLEESLVAFEEAIKLIKLCNGKIEAAEQKVRILVENADGSVTDSAFDGENAT